MLIIVIVNCIILFSQQFVSGSLTIKASEYALYRSFVADAHTPVSLVSLNIFYFFPYIHKTNILSYNHIKSW